MAKLDWGSYVEPPLNKRWPALFRGRELFIIRNGGFEFPQRDTRVWPFSSISAVGYLNVAPILFRIDVKDITSKDGVLCCCVISYEVQIKNIQKSREEAVSRNEQMHSSFSLLSKECAVSIFKKFDYPYLLDVHEDVQTQFKIIAKQVIKESTPYDLIRVDIASVASIADEVDEQIRKASSTKVTAPKIIEVTKIEENVAAIETAGERQRTVDSAKHNIELVAMEQAATRTQKQLDIDSDMESTEKTRLLEMRLIQIEKEHNLDNIKKEKQLEFDFAEKGKLLILKLAEWIGKDATNIMAHIAAADPNLAKEIIMNNANISHKLEKMLAQMTASKAFDRGTIETFKAAYSSINNINIRSNLPKLEYEEPNTEIDPTTTD